MAQIPKLIVRVRFPSPAPRMGAQVRSLFREANLACPWSPWAVRRLVRDLITAAPPSIRRDAEQFASQIGIAR